MRTEVWVWFLVAVWFASIFLSGYLLSDFFANRRIKKAVQPLVDHNERILESRDFWRDEFRGLSAKYGRYAHRRYQETDEDAFIRLKATLAKIAKHAAPDARDERDVMVGKLETIMTDAKNALE